MSLALFYAFCCLGCTAVNDLLFKFYQYNIVTDEIAEQIDAYYEKNFRSLSICDRM